MKILPPLLLLSALPFLAGAAATGPTVTTTPAGVFVDGVKLTITDDANVYLGNANLGSPAATIANRSELAAAVELAWRAYRTKVVVDAKAEVESEKNAANKARDLAITANEKEKNSAIAAARKSSADEIAANAAALTAARARAAALEQYVATLNTYIANLRNTVSRLGGTTTPPPSPPK